MISIYWWITLIKTSSNHSLHVKQFSKIVFPINTKSNFDLFVSYVCCGLNKAKITWLGLPCLPLTVTNYNWLIGVANNSRLRNKRALKIKIAPIAFLFAFVNVSIWLPSLKIRTARMSLLDIRNCPTSNETISWSYTFWCPVLSKMLDHHRFITFLFVVVLTELWIKVLFNDHM